jgi:hypothetical protein
MSNKYVNNWKAASELEVYKQKYLDPLNKRVVDARAILDDLNQKWKGDQKDRAKKKYQMLDTQNIDLHRLYNSVMELIQQHENQTDLLVKAYIDWYKNISNDGMQPKEMMGIQATMMQDIFYKIYQAVENLKLDINPPKKNEVTKNEKKSESLQHSPPK